MNRFNSAAYVIRRIGRSIKPIRWLYHRLMPSAQYPFDNSRQYWEDRYKAGGNSGEGSYGPLAKYKRDFIRQFSREHQVHSAIEFGCGDGNQAALFDFADYTGVDVSELCIEANRRRVARDGWRFLTLEEYHALGAEQSIRSELALSLDVVYHLIEDAVYFAHLDDIFGAATRFVLIYASNFEDFDPKVPHVRHRAVVQDASERFPDWHFVRSEPNPYSKSPDSPELGSFADFHVFERLN